MFKFLFGLVLLQAITVSLFLLAPGSPQGWDWVRLLVPMLISSVLIAFWFKSLAQHMNKDEIMRLKEKHALEREKLKVKAERDKHQVTKSAQKRVEQEIRNTSAKANFKVGAAVAGAVGVGGLLLLTQFMTLGVLVVAAAGGTAGGYVLRIKQERSREQAKLEQQASRSARVLALPPKDVTPKLGNGSA
ncbi:MAG TPA: hypothetical protein PLB10_12000 [Thiolinea sp.]|nr:hypothetical protein [Thiolinea sp.]